MPASSQPSYQPTLPPSGRDVLVNGVRELRAWGHIVASERRDALSGFDQNHWLMLGQRISDVADRLVGLLGTPDAGGDQS